MNMTINLRTGIIAISLFILLLSPILLIHAHGVSERYPNDTPLSVGKATYALCETVCITLTVLPEEIIFFNIISPTGIIYTALPSTDREYQFKPDTAGNYVINVLLRSGDGETFLTTGFAVADPEIVFGEPEQGGIVVGEPVNWSQHISITNHERFPISNFSVSIPLPTGHSNLSSDAGFTIIDSSIPVDLAAGEGASFNISYQTPPVRLAVIEEGIGILDLIPHDAFDIGVYKEIGTDEEEPELTAEITIKQVKVWHNSSIYYHNIPVAIDAEECEGIVELLDGAGMIAETTVERNNKTILWTIPQLSDRTYAVVEVTREQGDAEIDEPIEWQLNVSGIIVRYKTPAPYNCQDAANDVVGVNITNFSVFAPMATPYNPLVVTLNRPYNGSKIPNNWTLLNATVTDADNDNMTVCFYANNNSNGLNASEGLVYIAENVANGTTLTYNLTALPVKPSEDGLAVLMHFDNRSEYGETNTLVYDFSGNGKNGTMHGDTFISLSGKFGGAAQFDGTGDYVSVTDDDDNDDPTAYTISTWVKPEKDVTRVNIIVRTDAKGPKKSWSHQLRITSKRKFEHYLYDVDADKPVSVTGSTTVESGKWYHIVGIAENAGNMSLYVNGREEGTTTIGTMWTGGDRWFVGSNAGNGMAYYNGLSDDVAIYNRAISAEEILDHYRMGEGTYYWNVNASDRVSSNESGAWNFEITSTPPPDIRVVDVKFDHWDTAENRSSVSETGTGYHVKENKKITINATIANYGVGNATSNFKVSFFDSAGAYGNWSLCFWNSTYNVLTEGELGSRTTGYPYNTTYVTGYWNPSLVGTHNISVWADPDDSIYESQANTTNNNASALINVSAWQKYYGNASGSIALTDRASESVYDWTWGNETDAGYVYIVNAGVTVNWSALHALGCDSDDTLNASGQDFLDADTNLAMVVGSSNATGFANNNITELFSSNDPSNATNKTTFIVYGTSISHVPIVNSTMMTNLMSVESANFITGLLWDATSDTNGYYDTTDDENLVFVTKIRVAAVGIGSTAHNYEFAAPCTLNPMSGGDLDIYMELK